MKKYILVLLSALLFSSLGTVSAQNVLEVRGSTTLFPLIKEIASLYMDDYKSVTINVKASGSSNGLRALDKSRADLAMASRELKEREQEEMPTIKQQVIAYDALSIIVHPSNRVGKLTTDQLRRIFTGEIKNWKEVGGRDEKIQVYTRDKDSGTYGFMRENTLQGNTFAGEAVEVESNSGMVQQVSKSRNGIGYIGLAYAEDIVKTVGVSKGGGEYIRPTFKNAMEKRYPIIRPLSLFYLPSKEYKVKSFIEFCMSSMGQKLAAYEGYIPAKF